MFKSKTEIEKINNIIIDDLNSVITRTIPYNTNNNHLNTIIHMVLMKYVDNWSIKNGKIVVDYPKISIIIEDFNGDTHNLQLIKFERLYKLEQLEKMCDEDGSGVY